jgi:DNA repair protein RecN (Recombination protein N)
VGRKGAVPPMLLALRIHNFTVVQEVEVSFGPGLTVLTGETGAGKSILVDALGLLLGGRADAAVIRAGADEASVEAVFQRTAALGERLAQLGLPDSGEEVCVRRVVGRAGRSRTHVNGALATVGVLGQLFQGLLDIAGQHAHVALFQPAFQRSLLDRLGEVPAARQAYRVAYAALQAVDAELAALGGETDAPNRLAFLRFQVEEVERLAPSLGEDSLLDEERRRLSSVERLRGAAAEAEARLCGEGGAAEAVGRALATVGEALRQDVHLEGAASALRAAQGELEEAARALRDYLGGLEPDPHRLAEVEDRLDALRRLCRKHGADLAGVLARAASLRTELSQLEGLGEALEALRARRSVLEAQAWEAARTLRSERERAASGLSRAVRSVLSELALSGARFRVEVAAADGLGPEGADDVAFLFSANPGEAERSLQRVASGGEASRLLLGLRRVFLERDACQTVVLDEADAGVGGAVADAVGRLVREVARGRQVLCVTHLPQVAAHADAHLVVHKALARGRAASIVTDLPPGAPRVAELARMLSGVQVSEEAVQAAEALLRGARLPTQGSDAIRRRARRGADHTENLAPASNGAVALPPRGCSG